METNPGFKDNEVKAKNAADGKSTLTEMKPWPPYIQHRINIWNRLKAEFDADLAAKEKIPIKVTLQDGTVITALKGSPLLAWKSSPYDIACGINISLKKSAVVARVNGQLWDLGRPLEKDSSLQLLDFKNDEGKEVFWHSTSHVLGQALERCYGGCLCYGLSTKDGFYHDIHIEEKNVSKFDLTVIENVMRKIIKENQPFERLEMKKEDLVEMFQHNKFKLWIINNLFQLPEVTAVSVYKCGPLIDVCHLPHVRHTGSMTSIILTNNSSSHWEGDQNVSLQRVYGISFPDPQQLEEWQQNRELAANKDHRKIGSEQELFFFDEFSPGSCFFLPNGTYIYNILVDFIRSEYRKRGFQEVKTPNVFKNKLWEISGHWKHYAENMFSFEMDKEAFAMKPMNCPGHCLIFNMRVRHWRELPLRLADFGALHRNEISGALGGLTRVRRFQQDDAHIFCRMDQLESEINDALSFMGDVYKVLGFSYVLGLSTRPVDSMGDSKKWSTAEAVLEKCLRRFTENHKRNDGDGAFYGPKIDVTISDSMGRDHQCGTIQLDLQLPINFDLSFINEAGEKEHPVIIHRAILGSVERMMAILIEDCGGKWPFWLNPKQCVVVPVSPHSNGYAQLVRDKIRDAGFQVDADCDLGDLFEKKIRNAQLAQYNFVLVVGKKEEQNKTVNLRTRQESHAGKKKEQSKVVNVRTKDEKEHGEYSVERVVQLFTQLSNDRARYSDNVLKEYEKVQPNTLPDEVKENPSLSYKVALIEAQNQLVDLQSQLNTLHGEVKEVKELKEAKMSLEMDLNESKKQVETADVVIQQLEVDRALSEKKVDELNAELIKAKATQQELELNLDTMRIKLESASNGAGVELAREQAQLFEDQVPENVTLAKQFKELAKRHLHIIANSGEMMYNGFERETKEFFKNLKLSLSLAIDDISASQKIKEVIDVVTIQLQDIEKCRQDFKTKVDVLMDRMDKGKIQFADLDVKASRPQFKIAPESFEEVFQNLTGFSDVNSIFDSIQLIQVASPDA